ncbi:MAG: ABC transporter permease subunit [Verrucomicrobia bacterium]|nr:ABC transporter permease subunit [Verrucomicrobiota bacterium]
MNRPNAHFRKAKIADRVAEGIITSGGISIIVCVVAILVLIVKEAVPLFYATQAKETYSTSAARESVVAVGSDEYLDNGFIIYRDGKTTFFAVNDIRTPEAIALIPPLENAEITDCESRGNLSYTFTWSNGAVTLDELCFEIIYENDAARRLIPKWKRHAMLSEARTGRITGAASRFSEDGLCTVVAVENRFFRVTRTRTELDLFGNASTIEEPFTLTPPADEKIEAFALNGRGDALYAATSDHLILWDLSKIENNAFLEAVSIPSRFGTVTAMTVMNGDESVALGHANGKIATWSRVFGEIPGSAAHFRVLHELPPHRTSVKTMFPSLRDKSLVSIGKDGILHLTHMTSESLLLERKDVDQLAYLSPRNNGLTLLSGSGRISINTLDMAHPAVTLRTLFGKVWYESYPRAEFVWQSSSADDDAEAKLSLIPLIFGSLKGTFYALILAIPLAIFGALYTSQCTHPSVRAVIKPAVEIMAAVPSVIIGFLAALWLAPLIERNLASFFASFITVPVSVLAMICAWNGLRQNIRFRIVENGYEFLALIPVLLLGCLLATWLGPQLEQALFHGDVKQALYSGLGIRYDPRNCVVIAFALGFAVIPIIFTIAEDAFSNVPGGLTAASLACGASRWQTLWRVVLPSASPGLFAAVVIGFGRAVGETMIVLMATGNTPILELSPFNGMRTLSANIAVEIPEAPHGGTLYRTLFLSAVLLFFLTSILNTAAELVRQRLRNKYGQFQ